MDTKFHTTLPEQHRAIKVLGASALRLEENVSLPKLADEDILVRVHYVALNPFDWSVLNAVPSSFIKCGTDGNGRKSLDLSPAAGSTFGCDVAGQVVGVGRKCRNDIQIGDWVFGPVKGNASDAPENGGFAEYAAIREVVAWKVPEGMGLEHAATLGMSLMTVGLAVHFMLKVPLPLGDGKVNDPGRFLFIYGAGTATGTLAVQCAAL